MAELSSAPNGKHPARVEHHPQRLLVTGGAGFIGSNLVHHLLQSSTEVRVVNLDLLTYAGCADNLADLPASQSARHRFVKGDICDAALVSSLLEEERIDTIIHLAAESHVDRSLDGPLEFVRTNVLGTVTLLHAARRFWAKRTDVRFHHVSTDEVYGSLGAQGSFIESSPYDPSSPYSASKAGSDHLVRAWQRSYGMPVTITNCSNNYGPFHFPEKLIPLIIANALAGKSLPVYGDGLQVRDWLYVEDHCRAIDCVVRHGRPGETYNVGGRNECTNLDLVRRICDLLDAARPSPQGSYRRLITHVTDRPGHDRRYAIDAGKIERDLGWAPQESLASGLDKTVAWFLANGPWISAIQAGRYAGERLGLRQGH